MTTTKDDLPASGAPGKPTLRTIAEATGFAVTTVSRALADDPRIAAKTRRKVAETAERLGYVPDRAARRLRTGRTQVIGLLINTGHEFLGFTNELLVGLIEALRGTGYAITVVPDLIGGNRTEVVENILRNRLADGLIFTRTECFDPRVRLLTERGFPFVSHGRTEFTTAHPWVDYDNAAFARIAVERLLVKGRRRLSLILPEDRFTFAQHLRFGFMSAVREAGVAHELVTRVSLDSTPQQIAEALRKRRSEPDPPDGYVCVGEVTALATISALHDSGATPGVDADVVAKRASPIFDIMRPRIDTVFEDLHLTGKHMGEILLRGMAGTPPQELQVLMDPKPDF